MWAAWRHRRWRWLLAAGVVSLAGDLIAWIALIAFLVAGTGVGDGASWIAAALIAGVVPRVVLGPVSGIVADRLDRRRLLVSTDLGRATAFAAMAVVVALDGPRVVVVVLVACASALGTAHRPALVAATPYLVGEDDLGAANAAQTAVAQISIVVGPALGAALVTLTDPAPVIALNAACLAASALLLTRIGDVGGGERQATGPDIESPASTRRDIAEGFAVVRRDPGLVGLVALVTVLQFTYGAEQVLYVLVARDRLDLGAEGVGLLFAAAGLGGLAIVPFTAALASSRRLGLVAGIAGIATTVPFALMAVVGSVPFAAALAAVEGAGAIVYDLAVLTLLQRAVAEQVMGRVCSVQDTVGAVGETIGSVLAPLLVGAVGLGATLGVLGTAGIAVIGITVPALVALGSRLEARRIELRATTVWLGTIEGFGSFDPIARERLARAATEIRVDPGAIVITEGDRPDHLYVVRSGRLRVTTSTADGPIPDLGPDDLFGEIGLLRGVRRTATVTAAEPSTLVRIAGPVFCAVALGEPARVDPIAGGMRLRLARTHPHLMVTDRG